MWYRPTVYCRCDAVWTPELHAAAQRFQRHGAPAWSLAEKCKSYRTQIDKFIELKLKMSKV